MVGIMALYSSSPPTSWTTQCSMSSKTTAAATDSELHARGPQAHHHQHSSKSVKGGLSSLFSSSTSKPTHHHSACSASDILDSSSHVCSGGSLRGSPQAEMAYGVMSWDNFDSRTAAVNIPLSSLKSRERSPVSVLQGPISRSSNHGSPVFPSSAWENGASGGLPPLDQRRRSSLSGDRDRWPMSRSVGFEIGNSEAESSRWNSTCRASSESETAVSSSEPLRVEGFGSGAFAFGNSPLDTLTLPLYTTGKGFSRTPQRATPGILEAREKILRLAEEAHGLSSSVVLEEEDVKDGAGGLTSADQLLKDAQAKHKVFYDPAVVKAFRMAEEAHKGQFRMNGDMYLAHCVETAMILAATGVGSAVVAAGLLHDAIDDSNLSLQLLHGALGEDVASLVIGVSKLSQFSQLARDNQAICDPAEADKLRTMILAMVDVRVVLIKLADRLHNMRTLEALPVSKQFGIAKETLEIFAPLANRLGIWSWKAELEDRCFKCLKPVDHQDLSIKLEERCREGLVMSSIEELEEALRSQGVQFIDLCGRPKNLYSIYRKMTKKKRTVEEILDVRGLRLIVPDEESCYKALEIVQQLWRHIPGKSKDYIADPKPNGYKSLHTVVFGKDGYPMEVQIRTMKMHHQAEYGLAAHWRYKEDNSEHSAFSSERVEWARWVLSWHSEILDTKLRVSPLGADLRPPCPFPVHNDDCPYADFCGLPVRDNDPVFIIKMENDNMVVQELSSGSTVGDLVPLSKSHMDFVAANVDLTSEKISRIRVNHQFVDTLEHRLRMGDLVEVIKVLPTIVAENSRSSSQEKSCGKIALEFQREQLKRLYLDGGSTDDLRTVTLERSPSVAGLT